MNKKWGTCIPQLLIHIVDGADSDAHSAVIQKISWQRIMDNAALLFSS